jgi:hypothetical protein
MAVGERSEATLLMSLWWDHAIGVAPIVDVTVADLV